MECRNAIRILLGMVLLVFFVATRVQADMIRASAQAWVNTLSSGNASDSQDGEMHAIARSEIYVGAVSAANAEAYYGMLRSLATARAYVVDEFYARSSSSWYDTGTVVDASGLSRPLPAEVFIHVGFSGSLSVSLGHSEAQISKHPSCWATFFVDASTAGVHYQVQGSSSAFMSGPGEASFHNSVSVSPPDSFGSYVTGYVGPGHAMGSVGGELVFPVRVDPVTGSTDGFSVHLTAWVCAVGGQDYESYTLHAIAGSYFDHTAKITAVTLADGAALDGFQFTFDSGYVAGPLPEPSPLLLLAAAALALLCRSCRRTEAPRDRQTGHWKRKTRVESRGDAVG